MLATLDFRAPRLGRIWPAVANPTVTINGTKYAEDAARGMLDEATRGKRVCVVIHGYNSPDSSVDPAYEELVRAMTLGELYAPFGPATAYETIVLVKWPGGYKEGYFGAELRAYGGFGMPGTAGRLRDVLSKLAPAALDIQAHSLGNGIMFAAACAGGFPVRNLISSAAAVENNCISLGKKFYGACSGATGKVLVFYSMHDDALRMFTIAKLGERALGYGGPVPIFHARVTAIDANAWSDGHSAFRKRDEFYQAWKAIL